MWVLLNARLPDRTSEAIRLEPKLAQVDLFLMKMICKRYSKFVRSVGSLVVGLSARHLGAAEPSDQWDTGIASVTGWYGRNPADGGGARIGDP